MEDLVLKGCAIDVQSDHTVSKIELKSAIVFILLSWLNLYFVSLCGSSGKISIYFKSLASLMKPTTKKINIW